MQTKRTLANSVQSGVVMRISPNIALDSKLIFKDALAVCCMHSMRGAIIKAAAHTHIVPAKNFVLKA